MRSQWTLSADLLGEIVEDDESVSSVVAEVLSHGRPRVRRQILQRCSVRGSRRNDDGILQRIHVLQALLRNGI